MIILPKSPKALKAHYKKRFLSKVKKSGGCWLWQGAISNTGYGASYYLGRGITAHKQAYILFKGAIPKGFEIRHSCDVRACANPSHLLLGTRKDNMQDARERGRTFKGSKANTHCRRGHAFDLKNTRYSVNHLGYQVRKCRQCTNLIARLATKRKNDHS